MYIQCTYILGLKKQNLGAGCIDSALSGHPWDREIFKSLCEVYKLMLYIYIIYHIYYIWWCLLWCGWNVLLLLELELCTYICSCCRCCCCTLAVSEVAARNDAALAVVVSRVGNSIFSIFRSFDLRSLDLPSLDLGSFDLRSYDLRSFHLRSFHLFHL